MNEIAVLGQGWFFIPTAFVLGLLHGLEPGHSKTMMAAFIVATRGTVGQAIVLALAATVSHTVIVWIIALGGLAYGGSWLGAADSPWLKLVSAVLVIGIGAWMLLPRLHERSHSHHHDDAHTHAHAQGIAALQEGKSVTMGQVILFGLTGGLVPCAAAITVLLLCLQTHRIALGAVLVLSFSLGLAATLMGSAVAAAWGMKHVGRHLPRFDGLIRRAPYAASGITLMIGLYLAAAALLQLG